MGQIHGRFDTQTILMFLAITTIIIVIGGLSLALFGFGLLT